MDKQKDLWTEVGNKCLRRASELLDSETTTTAATAEVVKSLVETAISMDLLNLRWAIQNRSGAATRRAGTAVVSSEADIKAAAAAIHGRLPEALKRIANKDSESEERLRREGPEDPQP